MSVQAIRIFISTGTIIISAFSAVPAYAEYDVLLNNIYSIANENARARARRQGSLVSNLATGFIDRGARAIPQRRIRRAVQAFSDYVGSEAGTAWQNYAERTLEARANAEVTRREPEIRARFEEGQTRSAEAAAYEARRQAVQDERARTYGPEKPNAFY